MSVRIATALAVSLAVAACSDTSTAPATTPGAATPTPPDGATMPTTTAAPSTTSPARTLRSTLGDVLRWVGDPATLDVDRFSNEFLEQVPPDQLVAVFESLGAGQWTAGQVVEISPSALSADISGPAGAFVAHLELDADGRIAGLFFEAARLDDLPESLNEVTERLRAWAPHAGYVRADVTGDGDCRVVAQLNADELFPLGSTFKLYVLGAVAAAVAAGALGWDRPVEIRDELDSLPSGVTQEEPAGSTLTVGELAQRMIEVSDNTATDHLLALVGREAVEAALPLLGHSDPTATIPFMSTREMFVIKSNRDLLDQYLAADIGGRRALLDGAIGGAPLPAPADFPLVPTAATTVEWFATPADVCRALVTLDGLAAQPGLEPLGRILSTNPGVPFDPDQFSEVLFKGGSEPGVLFVAWLATRPDGSRVVVTGGVADDDRQVDNRAAELLAAALSLP